MVDLPQHASLVIRTIKTLTQQMKRIFHALVCKRHSGLRQ